MVCRSVREISPIEWHRVYPDVLESYHFYQTLEESGFDQFSFYYILIYRAEQLAGIAPCFLMAYPLDTTIQGPLKTLTMAIRKMIPGFLNLRALIAGLPMDQGRIGIADDNAPAVWDAMNQCLEQIAAREKASVIAFKDFAADYGPLLDPSRRAGFHKMDCMPSTEMAVPFASFDEYLKTLSRASRDGVKRKLKKTDGAVKIGFEMTDRLDPDTLEAVFRLYLDTARRMNVDFEKVPKSFFALISKHMPRETKYFLWRIDGKLVAFALCLVSPDRLIDLYLGFDYSVAHQHHLYFIRFRDLMNWCLRHKIKIYEMGTTGYEPKKRLGFDFVPLYVYARHRNPWLNPFFGLLCAFLKPERFDPVLNAMKRKKRA